MCSREERLAGVFVELADTLRDDFDVVDFLSVLSERSAELLDGPTVGVMLSDARSRLRYFAASTEATQVIELIELQGDGGPCLDCFHTATAVLNHVLDPTTDRWPSFSSAALDAGFPAVTALPMRLRNTVIGALAIFHRSRAPLEPLNMRLVQAFADIATVGILQRRAVGERTELAAHLQTALNHRIVIEQAKGMVGAALGLGVEEAFLLLRSFARSRNQQLVDISASVLDRSLSAEELQAGVDGASRSRVRRVP